MKSKYNKYLKVILFAAIIIFFSYKVTYATGGNKIPIPDVNINFNNGDSTPKEFVDNIKLILLLTVLSSSSIYNNNDYRICKNCNSIITA